MRFPMITSGASIARGSPRTIGQKPESTIRRGITCRRAGACSRRKTSHKSKSGRLLVSPTNKHRSNVGENNVRPLAFNEYPSINCLIMKTNGGSKPPPYVMKLISPLKMQRRAAYFLLSRICRLFGLKVNNNSCFRQI